ncbi:MAG: ATP-dependent DNA helicase [Polyangiaceae bacterium UTPRO1]|jgi:DNA helicase-2/ATP-dependent DNA helicase PcrA|nr:ATP-dependent helicase [Myxococcales bacterium]OQY67949.1 MAG: ATP-dependent DNA helicase [Polyangiaceae bacterium UTPRO1]
MKRYTLRREPAAAATQFRIPYADELNPRQLEAVTALDGPVLVIAGAGSGKTRTLVYRVARLVESGIPPAQILLLTFTRKAAEEMLRRASALVGGSCAQIAGGTFHSFAHRTLRRHGELVGIASSFSILDRGDSEDVIGLVRGELALDRKERRFPRKQTLAEIFSMAVNKGTTVVDLVTAAYPHLVEELPDLLRVYARYTEFKEAKQLLDYDDLLVRLRNALAERTELAARLGREYRYLMVDEYQDTNALQADIVRLLAAPHGNVMVVGDDAQSIYAFRGADFRNILAFPTLFPAARVVTLDQNYRSTPPILDLANEIINRAPHRYTKNLFSERAPGDKPGLVRALTEPEQSRFVAQRILELREEGVPLQDIAVLFRSSFHSFDLELELGRRDIPFVKRGGFRFIETAHVKDVLAHLRVVANPADAVSWNRILLLLDGVGPKKAGDILATLAGPAPWERLAEARARGQSAAALARLADVLADVSRTADPGEQVSRVLAYYEPVLRRVYRDDHPKRTRDLEHFASIACRYRATGQLLADMALEPPTDSVGGILAAGDEDEGLVTLSTIHSAKGLEWHTVFVLWAADGRFPSPYTVGDDADLEEERRLMYVAVTRAKDLLYLTYPIEIWDRGAGVVFGKPSRFIADLDEEILEPIALVDEEP